MKKDPNTYPKGWSAAKVRRIIRYYENQTDEEAAREIETAPLVQDITWLQVPTEMIPEVRRLIARRKKTA